MPFFWPGHFEEKKLWSICVPMPLPVSLWWKSLLNMGGKFLYLNGSRSYNAFCWPRLEFLALPLLLPKTRKARAVFKEQWL